MEITHDAVPERNKTRTNAERTKEIDRKSSFQCGSWEDTIDKTPKMLATRALNTILKSGAILEDRQSNRMVGCGKMH